MVGIVRPPDGRWDRPFRRLRPWPELTGVAVVRVEVDDSRLRALVFTGCQKVNNFMLLPPGLKTSLIAEEGIDPKLEARRALHLSRLVARRRLALYGCHYK